MQNRKALCLCFLLSAICFAATPASDADDAARIIQSALEPSPLQSNLQHLTDEIGGRVPGTPAMQQAVQWGVNAFKAAGADSVHTEEFSIPNSWAEGATEMTVRTPANDDGIGGASKPSLVMPFFSFRVRCVSIAWAPALAEVKHVPIVDIGDGSAEGFKKAGDIAGKIVLVHTVVLKTWDDLFAEYTKAPPVISAARRGKALAVAFIATREHDILYRHTNSSAG